MEETSLPRGRAQAGVPGRLHELGGRAGTSILRLEILLAGAADGAHPVIGQFLERSSRRDSPIGIALGRIVDIAAYRANVLLHRFDPLPLKYIED
jgi:hypothetical protein